MTITNRSADHMTVERQLVSYTVTRDDSTTDSAGYVLESEESLARLRSYPWASGIKVRVERSTFAVGDTVEVRAFGRTRVAKVIGFGRTKLQLAVIRNAQGDVHQGSYTAELVTNLTRPAVVLSEVADDAQEVAEPLAAVARVTELATRLEETRQLGAAVDALVAAQDAQPAEAPRALDREVKLTDRDSCDQVDLYLDGQLVLPALTREERNDLFQQLARLDAAVDHGYDVRELRGLDLGSPMLALVHNANVHHLALYDDDRAPGADLTTWRLDPRLTPDQVRAEAERVAAEVAQRVRDGQL